jgi:hypothetical protein
MTFTRFSIHFSAALAAALLFGAVAASAQPINPWTPYAGPLGGAAPGITETREGRIVLVEISLIKSVPERVYAVGTISPEHRPLSDTLGTLLILTPSDAPVTVPVLVTRTGQVILWMQNPPTTGICAIVGTLIWRR